MNNGTQLALLLEKFRPHLNEYGFDLMEVAGQTIFPHEKGFCVVLGPLADVLQQAQVLEGIRAA